MNKIAAFAFTVVIFATVALAQRAPTTDLLERHIGTWRIEERYTGDSRVYTKTERCRLLGGGGHIVCEAEADTPLGRSTSLSITSYDAVNGTYRQYTVSSVGLSALTSGKVVDHATVVGHTEFPFNGEIVKATVTTTHDSSSSWTSKMEASIGGSPTMVIQEAHATRVSGSR